MWSLGEKICIRNRTKMKATSYKSMVTYRDDSIRIAISFVFTCIQKCMFQMSANLNIAVLSKQLKIIKICIPSNILDNDTFVFYRNWVYHYYYCISVCLLVRHMKNDKSITLDIHVHLTKQANDIQQCQSAYLVDAQKIITKGSMRLEITFQLFKTLVT